MYPKAITEKIVEYWALGFTAEETRKALQEVNPHIGLQTIYRHRHSLTAQNLIDELLRHQERSILKADATNPKLAMHYRNELLKILMPQKIIALSKMETHQQVDITVNQLNEYEQALNRAVQNDLRSKSSTEQVDTAQTNS